MNYIGVDPGLNGGVARVSTRPYPPLVRDIPTFKVQKKTKTAAGNPKTKTEFDLQACKQLLIDLACQPDGVPFAERPTVIIESSPPFSPPGTKIGVASLAVQARGIMLWEALCVGLGFPYMTITPQRWKKIVWAGYGNDKNASYKVACQLYPQLAGELRTPRGRILDGRAEALCIATWGVRQSPHP